MSDLSRIHVEGPCDECARLRALIEAAEAREKKLREALEVALECFPSQHVLDALDTADGAGRRPAPLARTPTTAELRHWRAALGQEEGR